MEKGSGEWGFDAPTVIFEDENLLVLNKPSGVAVHGDGLRKDRTLADWLLETRPQLRDVGEPIETKAGATIIRPGIVHRLDKDTSGVMVVAKNQESFEYLKNAFKNREIKKVYNAFVYGVMNAEAGTIDFPIGRSRKDFRLRSAQPKAKGSLREAITEYKVLERGSSHSYVEVEPKTGRMHQIRVHFKAIHHPIVNDVLYAPNHPRDLGFVRLALHAREITLVKSDGVRQAFEAPLPEEFQVGIEVLRAKAN
jgi:23S rRNA pseudouridine1911/1915/1917 synthase